MHPRVFLRTPLSSDDVRTVVLGTLEPPASLLAANNQQERAIWTSLRNEFAATLDTANAIHASDMEEPFMDWLVSQRGFRRVG